MRLLSWGRYPAIPQTGHALAWPDAAGRVLRQLAAQAGTTLPFGNGRSYGDSCLAASGHVLTLGALDRFIAADWQTGILRAQAGVTLGEVQALAVAHGWILPVTPGTQFVTLGGALANDVHGKNHHVRGTFGRHVRRFRLLRSDSPPLECSPDEHGLLFRTTIGGLGLTGVVEWIEVQLMPVRSGLLHVETVPFAHVDEFLALSDALDAQHEYGVAWVDCMSRGAALGRGIYMAADHADADPSAAVQQAGRHGNRLWRIPFALPCSPVNRLTLKPFNALYYHRQRARASRPQGASWVDYARYFYPLDRIRDWNRLYGRNGFQQYQFVVPTADARDALRAALEAIAAHGSGSFLAVLKRCGTLPSPGLLSFPMPGISLALDFPQRAVRDARLFDRLDAIVREAGGRLYPAKDAHMSSADFRSSYPAWQTLESLRDPALMSRFWQRTTQS